MPTREEMIRDLQAAQAKPSREQMIRDLQAASKKDETLDPQAMLEGAGQGLTAGYLPQLQAAVGGAIPDPNADVNKSLEAQGFKISEPKNTYLNRRDENITRMQQEEKQSPASFTGGQLAGTLASLPLAGKALGAVPGLAKAATSTLGMVGQGAAGGALQGALQNPGDTPGQVDPLQTGERVQGAGQGAAFGGLGGLAAKGINKLLALPEVLQEFAKTRAAASVGMSKAEATRAIKMDLRGEEGKKIKEIGDFALKNNLFQMGDDIQAIASRSGQFKDKVGQQIGATYDKAEHLLSDPSHFMKLPAEQKTKLMETSFEPKRMGDDFLKTYGDKLKGTPQGKQTLAAAQSLIENFEQQGTQPVGIKDLQAFKTQLDDLIYKSDVAFAKSGQHAPGIESMQAFRDFIKDKMTQRLDTLDEVFGKSLGADLKKLNKDYGMASAINSTSRNRLASDLGNNFLSLTDKIALVGAGAPATMKGYDEEGLWGAAKGVGKGFVAGAASKAARTYGRPALTFGAQKLGQSLSGLPESKLGLLGQAMAQNPALMGAQTQGLLGGKR